MSAIVRGINPDKLSLVQTIAAERLKGLAMVINPGLYYQLIEERDRCRNAIPQLLGEMLGWEDRSGGRHCAQHAPKGIVRKPKPKKKARR